jgi:hypothetical protein
MPDKPATGETPMRAVPRPFLAALAVAAAFAAQPLSPSGADANPSSSTLSVWMYCEYGYCEATASGGSGNYTWTWTNANPDNTSGTISTATPCWSYGGQTVKITATANDGSTSKSASRWYTCSY